MLKLRGLPALLLLSLSLSSCAMPVGLSGVNGAGILASALNQYNFEVKAGFQIASVDTADQSVIEQAKTAFEADLKAGRTTAYQKDKNFSIHLLSGSEGNYFTSPEFLQSSVSQVLATLVVMPDSQNAQVYKGQFDNPRFVFADPSQQFGLSTRTKAYLLTADSNFQIQTYKGELVPDSEIAQSTTATSTTDATASDDQVSGNAVNEIASPLAAPSFASADGYDMAYHPELVPFPADQVFAYPGMNNWDNARNNYPKTGAMPYGQLMEERAWGPAQGQPQGPPQGPPQGMAPRNNQPEYDPFRNQATPRALPLINGKVALMAAPGVPGKFLARVPSGNPIPDPANKARLEVEGWIDAQGKFHPAEEGFGFNKVNEPRKQEVQVLRSERRSKVQAPAYPGPQSP